MKENFRSTDKPKKRKHTSYKPESQAALREAIKKAHSRIVGDEPLWKARATEGEKPTEHERAKVGKKPRADVRAGWLTERLV